MKLKVPNKIFAVRISNSSRSPLLLSPVNLIRGALPNGLRSYPLNLIRVIPAKGRDENPIRVNRPARRRSQENSFSTFCFHNKIEFLGLENAQLYSIFI